MFSISEAQVTDIPAIAALAEKTWWPAYSNILSSDQIRYMLSTIYSVDTLRKQITSGTQQYLLLRDDEGLQGFASFAIRDDDTSVAKLHKLYVLPATQGKGYGRALILEVTRRLSKTGVHKLDLNVNRQNPARCFYEKMGFAILREEDIPIGDYWMNDYVMRLYF